jgi:hypothetical protein
MRRFIACLIFLGLLCSPVAYATIFGQVHGVVHDPQYRPIVGVHVELRAVNSAFTKTALTGQDGSFSIPAVPLGDYVVTVSQASFVSVRQTLALASDTSPILHFELQLGALQQTVTVTTETNAANVNTVTPTTLISREDTAQTPGADRTNSLP